MSMCSCGREGVRCMLAEEAEYGMCKVQKDGVCDMEEVGVIESEYGER